MTQLLYTPGLYSEPVPETGDALPHEVMSVLEVDLQAIRYNYRFLQQSLVRGQCGAVLKANAYSFGLEPVAQTLAQAGCRDFFVAHGEEGFQLRQLLPDAHIYVLSGLLPGTAESFHQYQLIPVLGDVGQLNTWRTLSRQEGRPLPAVIHLDTGMARNGFDRRDVQQLLDNLDWLQDIQLRYFMSHLACAEDHQHPANLAQLLRLQKLLSHLPLTPVSFVNSAGIFLGERYQYDLARPGQALYGVQPCLHQRLPLQRAYSLRARVVQVRQAPAGATVGYGATYQLERPSRLAVVAVGYADGYKRSLSSHLPVYFGPHRAPVLGRVSMDYIVADITDVPESIAYPGVFAELLGEHISLEAWAQAAGTIPHEILIGLGPRCHKRYNP